MKNCLITGLAYLFLIFGPAAHAQEKVYPFWNANQILPLRASGEQSALNFSYSLTQQKKKANESSTERVVSLSEDYDLVTTDDTQILTDYRVCRVFVWKTTETDFANQSCYADPAFRPLELQNRLLLAEIMAGAMGKERQSS